MHQHEFTATFSGLSPDGHYLLEDVQGPGFCRDHVWVNKGWSFLPTMVPGTRIAFQAERHEYRRKSDLSPGVTLTRLRKIRVIE